MFDRIKMHFRDNKKTYVAVGIAVVVTAVICKRKEMFLIVDSFNMKINSPVTNNIPRIEFVYRGLPSHILQCDQTGDATGSINRMAELLNLNASEISQHLRGLRDDVKGYTFTKLGEMK